MRMKNKSSVSLLNRILLIVYILVLMTCWFCGWQALREARRNSIDSVFNSAMAEQFRAGNAVKTMAENLRMPPEDRLYYIAGTIRNALIGYTEFYTDDVSAFRVTNERGDEFYSTISEQLAESFTLSPEKDGSVSYGFTHWGDDTFIQVSSYVRIYDGFYRFDYLRDISNMVTSEIALAQSVSIVSIAATVIMIVLLYFSIKRALKPLRQLGEQARAVAGGNYLLRVKVIRNDEVGQIADDFNHMAEAVQEHVDTLSETARLRELFAANIAHEIKTPVTSIVGYADIASRLELGTDEMHQLLYYIKKEGQRLDKLSEKLLDWSKLGKQHEADIKNCRSERVISHIRYAITPILANKKQHLTIQNETAIMRIDEPLMISAIINLLQNASRASGEGKEIALSIYNDENQNLIVCVRDQGIGIDENEIAKILEPFYMIDESRDRANEGSGLGLSLCDAIVRAHGGEMRFESKIGEGTEVMIIIPQDN